MHSDQNVNAGNPANAQGRPPMGTGPDEPLPESGHEIDKIYDEIVNVRLPQMDGTLLSSHLCFGQAGQAMRVVDHPLDSQPSRPSARTRTVGRAWRAFDARGLIALPGYFDPHVHGALGADFTDADPASLATIARFLAQHGVTSFLATLISSDVDRTEAALTAITAAGSQPAGPAGARCWGIHLEGPFLNPKRRGMHDPDVLRPPEPALAARWLEMTRSTAADVAAAAGVPIRQVTLAPELPGADRLIGLLSEAGVTVSVGHTDATYEEARQALLGPAGPDQGLPAHPAGLRATHVTHTFNAMRPFHHREPGTVGAALDSPALCEVIGDGLHVHPAGIRLLVHAKGVTNVCLVSDLSPFAGRPAGEYALANLTIVVRSNGCFLPDGTLASSSTPYDQQAARLAAAARLNPYQLQQITAENVAREQGLANEVGSLTPGHLADVVLVDDAYQLHHVFVNGRLVR